MAFCRRKILRLNNLNAITQKLRNVKHRNN